MDGKQQTRTLYTTYNSGGAAQSQSSLQQASSGMSSAASSTMVICIIIGTSLGVALVGAILLFVFIVKNGTSFMGTEAADKKQDHQNAAVVKSSKQSLTRQISTDICEDSPQSVDAPFTSMVALSASTPCLERRTPHVFSGYGAGGGAQIRASPLGAIKETADNGPSIPLRTDSKVLSQHPHLASVTQSGRQSTIMRSKRPSISGIQVIDILEFKQTLERVSEQQAAALSTLQEKKKLRRPKPPQLTVDTKLKPKRRIRAIQVPAH
ncbi:hypothetical protein MP228_008465 [Amoeboaphelidium protococcarum]|nr:hypothetical protein MP228_008465 [Amoeboaphelidium protococcarum]